MVEKRKEKKGKARKEKAEGEVTDATDTSKKVSKKQNNQTKFAVITMVVLITSVFLMHWIIQESRKFEYKGIDFQKVKEGALTYYVSRVLNFRPAGYVVGSGKEYPFIFKFRNDPRKLEEIPVKGEIKIGDLEEELILSVSPEIGKCPDTHITLIDFGGTLKAFGIRVDKATNDRQYAKENKVYFADCKNSRNTPVILMKEANETEITVKGRCYILDINNCKTQQSFERFLLNIIENSYLG